jgi:hypothetical protein
MPLLFERFKVFENELVFCCNLFILLQNGLQSGFVLRRMISAKFGNG